MDPFADGSARDHSGRPRRKTASRRISKRSTRKKLGLFKWESSCGSMYHNDFWRSAKEKSQPSRQRCGSSELDPKAALRPSPSFIGSSLTSGPFGPLLTEPLARIRVDEKNWFGMIEWKAVREAASLENIKNLSHIEQDGLSPMPKIRGAEKRRR